MDSKQDNLDNFGFKESVKDLSKFKNILGDHSVRANEKTYTISLIREKELFLHVMNDLVESIDLREIKKRGRPSHLKDLLKACIMKVYLKSASRQLKTELKYLCDIGIINTVPNFNTINKFLDKQNLQQVLEEMITTSAIPLNQIETHFAIDATGISSYKFNRWLNLRTETDRRKDFVKAHICCGSKSKIITSMKVTTAHTNDCPLFVPLLNKTAKYFNVLSVSADKGYCSKINFQFAEAIGAQAYIPFKSNTTGKARGSYAFLRAFKLAKEHPELYNNFYHVRSLSESVFSSVKRRFLDYTRSKKLQARINEAYLKFVCYNICVLIRWFCNPN